MDRAEELLREVVAVLNDVYFDTRQKLLYENAMRTDGVQGKSLHSFLCSLLSNLYWFD